MTNKKYIGIKDLQVGDIFLDRNASMYVYLEYYRGVPSFNKHVTKGITEGYLYINIWVQKKMEQIILCKPDILLHSQLGIFPSLLHNPDGSMYFLKTQNHSMKN